ncbi:LPS assembly lipoprotein LptE [Hyphococcus sp.]|uniref:LPS assembly lipoprotein LptE n=1 Tax=Hyphococcus sp. TaxID=2038636 RepID=UPI003CCBF966
MPNRIKLIFAAAGALLLTGCGFRPIYATPEGQAPVIRQVRVESVAAPDSLAPILTDALNARMTPGEGVTPRYSLFVEANERAERLAVQIDATVTRYNYRLTGRYTVIDQTTGQRFRCSARSITSYNIVSSQYSTLFAEKNAIEKAATQLAEEIERDLLLRFSAPPEERGNLDPDEFEAEIDDSVILVEPRRGEVIKPRYDQE